MPALLAATEGALGGPALPHCQSRSLRLTRYARPDLKEENRKAYLIEVTRARREPTASAAVTAWQRALPGARTLHARLEARLLLNMAGSVIENAGLGLDRYGTVPLPGSALKGCARRTALATLRQWCETRTDDRPTKPTGNDLLAPIAALFASPAELFVAIVRVFGCSDLEWQGYDDENNQGNDLAWACAMEWESLRAAALAVLNTGTQTPDETAPTRRGTVAFLSAYPAGTPSPDLQLDVLTPHHKEYYEGKREIALDTEDPVPVFFPAVASGADYTFTMVPVGPPRPESRTLLDHAATWLLTGLTTFGLGAKTAAGYGWFSDVTAETDKLIQERASAARADAEARAAEQNRQTELARRKAREAALTSMTPEQRADAELAERASDWGWMKPYLTKFPLHPPASQAAILRWLGGAGRERWLGEIKPDSAKGKKPWSQIIGAIHAAKKTLKIDLP